MGGKLRHKKKTKTITCWAVRDRFSLSQVVLFENQPERRRGRWVSKGNVFDTLGGLSGFSICREYTEELGLSDIDEPIQITIKVIR